MAEPRWAAVVVNYNAGPHLLACVRSLLADASAGGPPEVVVVDNGSADGSADAVEAACAEVVVIRPGANLGFTRANNLGIAATRAPAVACVNPDVEVAPGTAAALVERLAAEPDVAVLGPRIRNPDGSTYPSARSEPSPLDALGHALVGLLWPTNPWTRRYRQLDADASRARDVDWLSGSALWLRREALDAVGGWDEEFFMYMEDVDLCWRLRRAGWRVAYEPAGDVVHVQGLSTSQRPYRMILEHHRSIGRLAAKRWHGPRRLLLVPVAALLALRSALAMLVHRLGGRRRAPRATD